VGISLFGSSSSYDKQKCNNCTCQCFTPEPIIELPKDGNPDPSNFIINNKVEFGKYLVIYIKYPDCNNYEGNKILVYEDVHIEQLLRQRHIDPHFSENKKYYSPIARFEPTMKGWGLATEWAFNQSKR